MTRELIEIMNCLISGNATKEQQKLIAQKIGEIHTYCLENGLAMPPLGIKKARRQRSDVSQRNAEVWRLLNGTKKYTVEQACQIVADKHSREISTIRKPFNDYMKEVGHIKID